MRVVEEFLREAANGLVRAQLDILTGCKIVRFVRTMASGIDAVQQVLQNHTGNDALRHVRIGGDCFRDACT